MADPHDNNGAVPGTLLGMQFRRKAPEQSGEQVWLTPPPAPVQRPGVEALEMAQRRVELAPGGGGRGVDRDGGRRGGVRHGGELGCTLPPGHHDVAARTHAAPREVVPVMIPPSPAPVIIPPAPTTTVTPVDAPQGPSPTVWSRYVVPAVAPVVNSAPSNIIDPSVVATATVPNVPLYAAPGAAKPAKSIANPNYLGATVVFLVTGYQPGWVQAYIPERPNESTAWIPSADVATPSSPTTSW